MNRVEIQDRYIELLLKVGINLQKGQNIVISAEPLHWEFLSKLTRVAYEMGANYVMVESQHIGVSKARLEKAGVESLEYVPSWFSMKQRAMIDEGWANLSFFGPESPDAFEDADPMRMGLVQKALKQHSKALSDACAAGEVVWCRAALPTPAWAKKVFPDLDEKEAEERLWSVMARILRLDQEDFIAGWKSHTERIARRGEQLNALNMKELRFYGGGTDLTVTCLPQSRWIGGGIVAPNGVCFVPNLPTEEVFTTPDFRKTRGKAMVVKPVEVLGVEVKGAWFEFEEGKVVLYGAESGEDALKRYFELCPQASFIGEVALVSAHSLVYESGLTFHSILYDENATSHIALGNGYALALSGGPDLSKSELLALGANVSLVHTDFMIGASHLSVDAVTEGGERVSLIHEGEFIDPYR